PERKHNIKKALKSFDGVVLEIGESLSFNKTTGKRNENNGYKKAKIITNGTFSSGFGGGVCQVSSTLYNACLLAGLEIVEANPHSLPVSYVEPSFDAMVNEGSSDLIIKNNTNGKIVITTSSKDDVCKIKIFGKSNKFKIERKSEVLKKIPASEERVEFDYEKYGLDLQVGEEKRVSFSKDGFESVGSLEFYDEKGNLMHTKKIRQNKYSPTAGVVVKREK
ncbi:MAG: VanW family protein, partial [Clostridia bacterium]|nr:VanW family protein [Clostridia bacterium]